MKYHKLFLAIVATSFLGGCAEKVAQEEYDAMVSDYQEQISALEAKIESQKEYIEQSNNAIKELSSDVDDFEYEDWRVVVPEVYRGVKDLEQSIKDPESF